MRPTVAGPPAPGVESLWTHRQPGTGGAMKTWTGLCVAGMVLLVAGSSVAARPVQAPGSAVRLPPAGNAVAAGNAVVAGNVAAAPLPPPDLALRLESLLGEHSVLAADLMRGRIRGEQDFGQTAIAALGQNTDAMTDLISSDFAPAAAGRLHA